MSRSEAGGEEKGRGKLSVYSLPSISVDSTNCRLKIFRKRKFQKVPKAKLEFVEHWQ